MILTSHTNNVLRLVAMALALGLLTGSAGAVQIFYESFEDPAVGSATSGTNPTGWDDLSTGSSGATRAGLGYLTGTSYTNFVGNQAAWLNVYNSDPILVTTTNILNTNLLAQYRYSLTFNAADDTKYTVYADLIAGSTVVLTAKNSPGGSHNFSANVASNAFLPQVGDPGVGEALKIRLRVTGGEWNKQSYIDNLKLEAIDSSIDTNAPTPDPMIWVQEPTPDGNLGMYMTCTVATDINWVEYLFTNTVNGHSSGWIDVSTWRDTGLEDGVEYRYKVKARDKSINYNETAWSVAASNKADLLVLFYESFERPVVGGSQSTTDPYLWDDVSPAGTRCGLGKLTSTGYSNYEGNQAAWLNVYNTTPVLQTTTNNLDYELEEDGIYTLTFNAADTHTYILYADLLAGTNVILTASVNPANDSNFANHKASNTVTVAKGAVGAREPLYIRLRVTGGTWDQHCYIDNLRLHAILPPPAGTVIILK